MNHSYCSYINSPIGYIELQANNDGLTSVKFTNTLNKKTKTNSILEDTVKQLQEYFLKKRTAFNITLSLNDTAFRLRVWNKLQDIKYGNTATYLEIAKQLGDNNATRAVGNANGKNPIAIIIPCHRIIGTNGNLTGYAGELWRKQWLLNHENASIPGIQKQLF